MPKNWNTTVSIQEAKAAYAVGDDLDAYCFLYEGDRVRPVKRTVSGDIVTLPPYVPPATLYTKTHRVIESLIANIVPVQSGNGDPSPENVRPIRGWMGINVQRTGFNQWNEEWEVGSINGATGEPASASTTIRSKDFIPVIPNTTYYITVSNTRIFQYDADKNYLGIYGQVGNTFTLNSKCRYIKFRTDSTYGANYKNDIAINYPSTETDYHAYTGQTYSINWETEVGVIYGATLDVTNGELIVTDAMIASYAGETLPSTWISDRDVYAEGTTPTTGAQVVYKLAIPQTYQLTPTEVSLLPGENNLFADTGSIILNYAETQEV